MWVLVNGLPSDSNTLFGYRAATDTPGLPRPTRDPAAIRGFLTKHLG